VQETLALQPNFEKLNGMVPAIAQDVETGEVLMLAWMNQEAFKETLRTHQACYYSRSRDRLWRKGEESGHVQDVEAIYIDCDADTVLLKVRQRGGAACHEGYKSCFFREVHGEDVRIVGERVFDPSLVYGKS
jgi:phosphoribosyl-AMP cyclohydrolase